MRIAIDIDSTLHHYWDLFADSARRRFGVDLPYGEQYDWHVNLLRREQLAVCVADTHTDEAILGSAPYPGAVEAVRGWHDAGHFIHITSHRDTACHAATARWLDAIGLPYDELYCSWDKVSHCAEIGIDVLIDDSPVNITRAIERGIVAATIAHPWNQDVREEEDVISADDWAGLREQLEPMLANGRDQAA